MTKNQKISTCLLFPGNAEEATNYYLTVFKNSRIVRVIRFNDNFVGATFELEGLQFMALNHGQAAPFNESVSLAVNCDTQAEIDELWDKLVDGGQASRCGWLKDRYGVSWQIVPSPLPEMLNSADPAAAGRAMQAMLTMSKLDLNVLQRAYNDL